MRTANGRFFVPPTVIVLCMAFSGAVLAADTKPAIKPYPLDKCIVSGKKLGEMGEPITFTYRDREIKRCCAGCKAKFDKDPEIFLKKIDEEAAKAKAAAPAPEAKKQTER